MSLGAEPSGQQQQRQLDELIDEYFELIESGQDVSVAAWVERYPDQRVELLEFFCDQRVVDQRMAPLRALVHSGKVTDEFGRLGDFSWSVKSAAAGWGSSTKRSRYR